MLGIGRAAAEDQRQLVGEGDRAWRRRQLAGQPAHEAGAVVARGRWIGWPSSMVSWVSKWLRVRSSVPAKGTKATWPFCHSG